MRQFYWIIEKGATLSHQLTWSHYYELIPTNNINIINYYIHIVEVYNLSVRELRTKIKAKEYERLPEDTKNKLITTDNTNIKDLVKNPLVIKNSSNYENVSEKILQN